MDAYDQAQAQLIQGFEANRIKPKKKGPGGVLGFLTNALPAIGGGLGAVAGIPLDLFSAGGSSAAGGAVGAGLGETLKRKILGEKLDPKQIGIQALEGGVLSGGKLLKAASGGAKALVKGEKVAKEVLPTTEKTGNNFFKNLTTQGQQAQGRVTGISAGSKVAGRELAPQDTAKLLQTLKKEGIKTGNANNTFRDITDKLKGYGQQISDHFKTNEAPLKPDDTKTIANNFIEGLNTTDPTVLKQAKILADDLEKNVKSTKSLWEFRKTLDSRIPDTKFMDENTSAKVTALKEMRKYISDELGQVPGMKNYHDLSEIKPFVSAESKRLNNPSGGIIGRVLSSGPVQKSENAVGKVTEKIGNIGNKEITPQLAENAPPAVKQGILDSLIKTPLSPVANPGQVVKQTGIQEAGRGFGIPASISQAGQTPQEQSTDTSISDTAPLVSDESANNPFGQESIQKAILEDLANNGGKNVDKLITLYKQFGEPAASKPLNSTQQQQANNAVSGLQDIQSISDMLNQDASLATKDAIPGGSIAHRLTGTTDYEAAKNNIIDVISRLRSGAAISTNEEKLYKSLLPGAADSAESAQAKLSRLSELLSSFANPTPGSGSDITDLIANGGQ